MKKNKGITLIALVVTIIVLLILAGISIATLTGQNGIITRSNEARDEDVRTREKDEIGLAYNAAKITNEENNKTIVKAGDLQTAFREDGVEKANTSQEGERIKIIYTDTGNIYYINENGEIIYVGVIESREGIKVGDYINYTPDTAEAYSNTKLAESITGSNSNTSDISQDTLNWQIFRIYDDGKMDLVGSPTNQDIYLSGALGYNNGAYIMHDICESLYSKPSKGMIARSMNYEDLEFWLTKESKEIRDNYKGFYSDVKYGETRTFTGDRYYPNLYVHEKDSGVNSLTTRTDGIGRSEKSAPKFPTPSTETFSKVNSIGITIKQTYWRASVNDSNFGEGNVAIYSPYRYWMSSRWNSITNANNPGFGFYTGGNEFNGYSMYNTNNVSTGNGFKLRPIVSLGQEIQITSSEGGNEQGNPHIINW